MQIDRLYAAAWGIGLVIHLVIALTAYYSNPASGEVARKNLVPVEIVEIEPEEEELVEQTVELPPEPEPEPEPIDLTEEPIIPTDADPEADPDAEPVFGLSEESVVETEGPPDPDALKVPIGNTIALPPDESADADTVKPLMPLMFHQVTIPPQVIEFPIPEYPDILRGANREGTVILDMIIGTDGKVLSAKALKSDHELFSKAAIEAALQARFTPGMQNGAPVPVRIIQPCEFNLD